MDSTAKTVGTGQLDEQCQLTLKLTPEALTRLGWRPGELVRWIIIGRRLTVMTQSEFDRWTETIAHGETEPPPSTESGLEPADDVSDTTRALLAALPDVRAEVVASIYGPDFLADLEQRSVESVATSISND